VNNEVVIRVENLYKEYRLGTISHGTLRQDLQSWWARMRGKEDPNSMISTVQPSTLNDSENPHFLALQDVSFEVKRGEVLGIIGWNGAGKSTLLKILSEVTAPTKGTVKIKGRVASLLEVGTGFHPELSGRENIYLNGAILGMNKREINRKFDEIVDFAEVEKFLDTPVKRYSSGMYVRLAFAVAAHLEPEILIIDEVLAVGDTAFQKKCLGKMQAVGREGRTVLFVSHNMGAISALCNKVLVLDKGNLIVEATTQIAVGRYLSGGNVNQDSVVEWSIDNAPGDVVVKLVRVATQNEQGQVSGCFDRKESIHLQLEYVVLIKRPFPIVVQIRIFDQFGICIFVCVTPHEQINEYGHYRSTCVIPPNLMNEGNYYLDVYLNTPLREVHLHQESVVSFKVIDSEVRDFYFEPIPGAVRPNLLWNTELIVDCPQ